MSEYLCKCGRKVGKSSKADNTGNRETVGCDGCPYLMPYGGYEYDSEVHHFKTRIDGYECHMSPRLEYATTVIGRADDKCTMHIDSLDFDFLGRVQAWIKEHYPAGEISGDFNPELMRACQYISDGRYRMSISCAQNKAGMAAKNELMRAFFDRESKRRLDMTPDEEKHKILGDIDRGKELVKGPDAEEIADQDWEEDAKNMSTVYVDSDGRLYRVGILNAGNADREKYTIFALGVEPGSQWRKLKNSPEYFRPQQCDPEGCAKNALNVLAMSRGLKPADDETVRYNENARGDPGPVKPGMTEEEAEAAVLSEDFGLTGPTRAAEEAAATEPTETAAPASGDDVCGNCVCRECDDERCLQAHCDCRDRGAGCIKPDDDCRHDHPELFPEADEQVDAQRPTSSAAATAAESQVAEAPGHADAANTMAEPAAIAAPEATLPVFDFGADASTNGVLAQCAQMFMAGRYAQFLAVKQAHDVTANHYQGSFGKFCEIIGISRDTGDRMVSVAANCGNIMIDGKPLIEIAQLSVLYAAAKPSAPAEAVEAVKAGDVTTMPEYKALLDQLARKDEAIKAAQEANEKNRVRANNAEDDYDAVVQRAEIAERRAREAEAQRKNLQDAEAAHAAKIRELESRPVDVAVRKPTDAEIERYRQEGYAKAQKEFAAQRDDESDFCETIADHAEAVADSCAEALAGWFRLAADIDDAAYAAGAEHIKALWLALREALQSGAWPTDDLDDDDDEEYDPDDDDEENSDE